MPDIELLVLRWHFREAIFNNLDRMVRDIDTNPLAAAGLSSRDCRATTAEGVENNIAGIGRGAGVGLSSRGLHQGN